MQRLHGQIRHPLFGKGVQRLVHGVDFLALPAEFGTDDVGSICPYQRFTLFQRGAEGRLDAFVGGQSLLFTGSEGYQQDAFPALFRNGGRNKEAQSEQQGEADAKAAFEEGLSAHANSRVVAPGREIQKKGAPRAGFAGAAGGGSCFCAGGHEKSSMIV